MPLAIRAVKKELGGCCKEIRLTASGLAVFGGGEDSPPRKTTATPRDKPKAKSQSAVRTKSGLLRLKISIFYLNRSKFGPGASRVLVCFSGAKGLVKSTLPVE